MSDERRSILQMLSVGKLTPDEAERLISALEVGASTRPSGPSAKAPAKYLRVAVDSEEGHGGPTKINIRVPMNLLRAGVRLSSILPPQARDKVNQAMREKGVPFDINALKPENLEELVSQLNDLTVDVDQDRTKVRIYCE